MSNLYTLSDDSTIFIIDPSLEADGLEKKINFILSINYLSLATNKLWTSEAIRKLAIGLVIPTSEIIDPETSKVKRVRKPKAQLILEILAYIEEEKITRDAKAAAYAAQRKLEQVENVEYKLNLLGFSEPQLATLCADDSKSPKDIAASIAIAIRVCDYAPSTMSNTLIPAINKVLHTLLPEIKFQATRTLLVEEFRQERTNTRLSTNQMVDNKNKGEGVEVQPDNLILLSERLLSKPDATWKELSIGLAIALGRRCSEILGEKSNFTSAPDKTNTIGNPIEMITFKGQLKTNNYLGEGYESEPYDIPTLLPKTLVLDAYARLKASGKLTTPAKVNQNYAKALGAELPRPLRDELISYGYTNFKSFRAIYASVVAILYRYKGYSSGDTIDLVMGHKGHISQRNYSVIDLDQYPPTLRNIRGVLIKI